MIPNGRAAANVFSNVGDLSTNLLVPTLIVMANHSWLKRVDSHRSNVLQFSITPRRTAVTFVVPFLFVPRAPHRVPTQCNFTISSVMHLEFVVHPTSFWACKHLSSPIFVFCFLVCVCRLSLAKPHHSSATLAWKPARRTRPGLAVWFLM